MRTRPDYLRRKIALEEQRRRHRAGALPGCQCPYCIAPEQVAAILKARNDAQRAQIGEPPF